MRTAAASTMQQSSVLRRFTAVARHHHQAPARALAVNATSCSLASSSSSSSSSVSLRRHASLAAAATTNRGSPRRPSLVVRAGWGDPVEFSAAKVVSNARVAEKLHKVVLDVGELAGGYQKGGQYVQVKVGDGKPGFFAIASPPDPNNQGLLEFLIKAQGDAAEALAALSAGAEVAVSPVMGKGFAVEKIPADSNPTVLMFATGSGISPIKALIESGALDADKRADVRLYYGTRDAGHTAYADCIPAWEKAGVKVIQVFSDAAAAPGKYVQDVFAADKGLKASAGVAAVLCGHKDMCNSVKESLAVEGVDADKVLLNF